jgi:hypothetical protein
MPRLSPRPAGPGNPGADRRPEPAGISRRGLEAIRLHDAGRVDEGEDGEDDVPGEGGPGRAKACEPGVNRTHCFHRSCSLWKSAYDCTFM